MAKLTPESAWEFADAIKAIVKQPTSRRRATVQNVDKDGTIWVQLPGSSTTTPISTTGANVQPGDVVMTEQRGTSLHITTNQTDPAVGTKAARTIAKDEARHAESVAKQAQNVADEAQAVAQATGQHFFADDNGAHITDVTQDEWVAAVDDNFSDYDPDTKPYHNQLLNSLGILLRTALNNLVSITHSAIAFYDGAGNTASNIVARFGSAGAQIGKSSNCVKIDNDSFTITNNDTDTLSVSGVETQYVKNGEIGFIPSDIADNPHLSINGGWTDLGGGLECADITLVARMPNANGAAMEIYSDSRNENYVRFDCDIKTTKDTAWITLNSYIKYRLHHGVCYVLGMSRSGGAAVGPAGGNIGTMPEGARPLAEVIGAATTMAKQFGQFSIDTNGVITVWNLTQSSANWAFNASYPVG